MSDHNHYLGWNLSAFHGDEHVIISSYLLILTLLFILSLSLQHSLTHSKTCAWIPANAAHILLGMMVGFIIRIAGGYNQSSSSSSSSSSTSSILFTTGTTEPFNPALLGFSPYVFYFGFLPLIIFESGFHLKRIVFYYNFGAIASLALIGTSISIVIISISIYSLRSMNLLGFPLTFSFMECVSFAALISSTDPVSTLATFSSLRVDPAVYYLVFGESVLNDALALTVFTVSSHYIGNDLNTVVIVDCIVKSAVSFVVSAFMGYVLGILGAWFISKMKFYHNKALIVGVYLTLIYGPFFLTECFQLSGIVAVLLAGVASRKYANKNISRGSALSISFVMKTFTSFADLACSCLLGMSVFSQSPRCFHLQFIGWVLLLISAARISHVYPLLSAVNTYRSYRWTKVETEIKTNDTRKEDKSNLSATQETSSDPTNQLEGDEQIFLKEGWTNTIENSSNQPQLDALEEERKSCLESVSPQLGSSTNQPGRIPWPAMHMVAFSGLRGAVSFACAQIFSNKNGNRDIVLATTTAIVLVTVVLQGSLTPWVIRRLGIKTQVNVEAYIRQIENASRISSGTRINSTNWKIFDFISKFEKLYIYPIVINKIQPIAHEFESSAPNNKLNYLDNEQNEQNAFDTNVNSNEYDATANDPGFESDEDSSSPISASSGGGSYRSREFVERMWSPVGIQSSSRSTFSPNYSSQKN